MRSHSSDGGQVAEDRSHGKMLMFCVVYSCSEKETFSFFLELQRLSFTKVRSVKDSHNNAIKNGFQPDVCGREECNVLMPVSVAATS